MYSGEYLDPIEGDKFEEAPLSALELHAEMYALGDKYQATRLSRLAMQKFKDKLKREWIPRDFLRSIAKVYKLTLESNRELRDATFLHARFNIGQFQSDDATRLQFKETCLDVPEFMLDVLESYIDVPLTGDCFQCGPHQPVEPIQLRCPSCMKGGARERDRSISVNK